MVFVCWYYSREYFSYLLYRPWVQHSHDSIYSVLTLLPLVPYNTEISDNTLLQPVHAVHSWKQLHTSIKMSTNAYFSCPIIGCSYGGSRRGRADFMWVLLYILLLLYVVIKLFCLGAFSEHIESHTKPYVCSVKNCELRFSRMSNLNRHRQTQHRIPQEYHLRTRDVLVEGEIHDRIRRYQSLDGLIRLLRHLGFPCSWFRVWVECQSQLEVKETHKACSLPVTFASWSSFKGAVWPRLFFILLYLWDYTPSFQNSQSYSPHLRAALVPFLHVFIDS